MRSWNFGTNSLYKNGHIALEEGLWYVFAIYATVEWICDALPSIPLPDMPIKDCEGKDTTLKDYYGDIQQLWHVGVCAPIFHWAESKKRITVIDMPYDTLRELFYETHKTHFDENEELAEEILQKNEEEK